MANEAASNNNYTLGRGELHFAPFKPGTQIPGGERYLGNSPSLSFAGAVEILKHINSDHGVGQQDASVALSNEYTGSFELDSISMKNIAMFFMGSSTTLTVAGGTVTAEPISGIEQGLTYQLGTTLAKPTGARLVSAVTIANVTTPANTPVLGVDYVVDAEGGRITIMEGSTKLITGNSITVGYTEAASSREQAQAKGEMQAGQLRYVAFNPAGKKVDFLLPWAQLTPNGDFNLKGDDWQVLPFNIEVLKKGNLSPVYADGLAVVPTP